MPKQFGQPSTFVAVLRVVDDHTIPGRPIARHQFLAAIGTSEFLKLLQVLPLAVVLLERSLVKVQESGIKLYKCEFGERKCVGIRADGMDLLYEAKSKRALSPALPLRSFPALTEKKAEEVLRLPNRKEPPRLTNS